MLILPCGPSGGPPGGSDAYPEAIPWLMWLFPFRFMPIPILPLWGPPWGGIEFEYPLFDGGGGWGGMGAACWWLWWCCWGFPPPMAPPPPPLAGGWWWWEDCCCCDWRNSWLGSLISGLSEYTIVNLWVCVCVYVCVRESPCAHG